MQKLLICLLRRKPKPWNHGQRFSVKTDPTKGSFLPRDHRRTVLTKPAMLWHLCTTIFIKPKKKGNKTTHLQQTEKGGKKESVIDILVFYLINKHILLLINMYDPLRLLLSSQSSLTHRSAVVISRSMNVSYVPICWEPKYHIRTCA